MVSGAQKLYYFAYASNLDKKQMRERCPESKPLYMAVLPNYKLTFVGWSRQWRGGTASIKRFTSDKVPGAVYEVTERDMRRLDGYEGYPGTATRINVTVFNEDSQAIKSITYTRAGQPEEVPPSKEYAATIRQGYREWGII
ncbi:MAG: gamma-glutamylcyclotransferase family protein [Dehalococcoidales bacterium]|nr:gamma-glutamylcyclotransferase family protein [Dehalococcoidales bacterium]